MKVLFEFDTVEDRDELKLHQRAKEYHEAVYQVTLHLRNYYKHLEPAEAASDAEHRKALEELLERISQAVDGLGYWDEF